MDSFSDFGNRKITEPGRGLAFEHEQFISRTQRLDQERRVGGADELDSGEGGPQILDHMPLPGGMEVEIEFVDQNDAFHNLKSITTEMGIQSSGLLSNITNKGQH